MDPSVQQASEKRNQYLASKKMHIYSVCVFGLCMQYQHPAFVHSAIGQLHTLFNKIVHNSEAEVVKI
jgi:hypothetical protein